MKNVSEILFEQFLNDHSLPFHAVPTVIGARRPDYQVDLPPTVMFEVKELTEDDRFAQGPHKLSHRTVGAYIRKQITGSKKQIQFGSRQGSPSVLLIYNALDYMHMYGTEDIDFEAALHGEWTLRLSRETGRSVAAGYGANRSLQQGKNTSFSALAHMVPIAGILTVRLFLNTHAVCPLPATLPACFEVITA